MFPRSSITIPDAKIPTVSDFGSKLSSYRVIHGHSAAPRLSYSHFDKGPLCLRFWHRAEDGFRWRTGHAVHLACSRAAKLVTKKFSVFSLGKYLDFWCNSRLIDLRMTGAFATHGALKQLADKATLPHFEWRSLAKMSRTLHPLFCHVKSWADAVGMSG